MGRALQVRRIIMKYASDMGIPFDKSQFTVLGHGIDQPLFPMPKTEAEWLSNMRVVFRIVQIEAEETAFKPVN